MAEPERIALVGLRGSGKSTVGRLLAERLGVPFVDLDEELGRVQRGTAGEPDRPLPSAGELLAALGEPAFRELEARALRAALSGDGSLVLSTGGGVVERGENRERLRSRCTCVWLDASPEVLLARVAADPTSRPPLTDLGPARELAVLAGRRAPLYAEVAAWKVDTSALEVMAVARVILERLRR